MSGWTIAWLIWLAAFVVIEGMALSNDMPGDTLSAHTRKWFSVKTKLGRTAFLVLFGIFAAWFCVHIAG